MTTIRHLTTEPVLGADLHPGDIIDTFDGPHAIDHFREYPGVFVGDHARRAFFDPDEAHGWTVADHERFHVQSREG